MTETLRIFTTVNFSAGENISADSGFTHLSVLIMTLLAADPCLHFYVLVPDIHLDAWRNVLLSNRVTLLPFPMVRRLHGGDFQFNPRALFDAVDFRSFEFDILFLNQLETVPAFMNFFNRLTFHNLPAVSYMHWFDTRRPSTPRQRCHEPALLAALAGMSSSNLVGCNSEYAKRRVLATAGRWFNHQALAQLEDKLRILPPMISLPGERQPFPRPTGDIRVVVNHRMLKYTGVRPLLDYKLPEIWDTRRDFHVHVTNPSRNRLPKRMTEVPWMTVATLERNAYHALLSSSDVVIAPHRSTDWSMSTLEAICAGAVPLMNRESFFPEMFGPILGMLTEGARRHVAERWFFYRQQFRRRFEAILDNIVEEREIAYTVMTAARRVYAPSDRANSWLRTLRDAAGTTPALSPRNPSVVKLRRALEERGKMTREDLLELMRCRPQTRTVAWTSLRRALLAFSQDDPCESNVGYVFAEAGAGRLGTAELHKRDGTTGQERTFVANEQMVSALDGGSIPRNALDGDSHSAWLGIME